MAGYALDNKRIRTPANSGGSILLVGTTFSIKGGVSANGQSSDNGFNGAGAGGRISFYDICWVKNTSCNDEACYDFIPENLKAIAGERPIITPNNNKDTTKLKSNIFEDPVYKIALASNGTVLSTPCSYGEGIICS